VIVAALLLSGTACRPASSGSARATPQPAGHRLEQHLATLRARLPEGFTIAVAEPFVVVGNEDPDRVHQRAEHTVRWAAARLRQDFFARDPADIIDVWLFADARSYEWYSSLLFGRVPATRFGFYLASHHALVMNISTGGGTLVHEMVHPFIAANAPDCPPWLDEGLASLFEQASERNGHIVGLPNWRLPALQDAIRADTLPSFARLTSLDKETFYGPDSARNYAQARYLCYDLQEHNLLTTYWKRYLSARDHDPTGYATLTAVLGVEDMTEFEQRWRAFILTLHFS
jgi:hypothetical protein